MPWVHRHRRRLPYSWFRTTTVSSHYRRSPDFPIVVMVAVVIVLLFVLVSL
jgi:hypothetical protein